MAKMSDLVQLDQLVGAWAGLVSGLHGDQAGAHVTRRLRDPSIFNGISRGAYTGILTGNQRMYCLLDHEAIGGIRENLETTHDVEPQGSNEDGGGQQSQQSFLDDLFGEEGGGSGPQEAKSSSVDWSDSSLKFIEALKIIRPEDYDEIKPTDVSEKQKARAVFQAIMKHNKTVKKTKAKAGRNSEASRQLDLARSLAALVENVVVISVDLEWHEQDQSILLEIGWSIFEGRVDGVDKITMYHHIVEENLGKSNGRFVPDNRRAFLFGESLIGSEEDGAARLKQDCSPATWRARFGVGGGSPEVRVALVGHGMSQDLQVMRSLGINIEGGVEVIDTNNLVSALYGTSTQVSLRALLSLMEIPGVSKLHNAGNDAAFTLHAFLALARR